VAWTIIGMAILFRDDFLSPEQQAKLKGPVVAQVLSWQIWTIAALVIVGAWVFEASFRGHRRMLAALCAADAENNRAEAETTLIKYPAPHLQEARKRFVDDAINNLTPSEVTALKMMVITGRPTEHINEFNALEEAGLIAREFPGPKGLKIRDELLIAIQDRLLRAKIGC
jgi:hypothetical protein